MKAWIKSDVGLLAYGIVMVLLAIVSNYLAYQHKELLYFCQVLCFSPVILLSIFCFREEFHPYFTKQSCPIALIILLIYLMIAYHQLHQGQPAIQIFQYILFIGPFEELGYRGIVYLSYRERHGEYRAWLYTAILFAIVHMGQMIFQEQLSGVLLLFRLFMMMLLALVIGGVFILLLEYSHSFWVPIVVHALYDLQVRAGIIVIAILLLYYGMKTYKATHA